MRPRHVVLAALLAGCGSSALSPDAGSADTAPLVDTGAGISADVSIPADGPPPGPDAADAGSSVDAAVLDAEDAAADAEVDAAADAEVDAGTSIGKFCHELNRSGHPVVLTLELGDPAAVRIPAMTGRCAPPVNTPCAVIPAGQVRARIFEGDKLLSERQVVLGSGKEFVFQAAVDSSTLQVVLIGGSIAAGTCSGLDFPEPDGGAPPAPDGATD